MRYDALIGAQPHQGDGNMRAAMPALTKLEKKAKEATDLAAFPINLPGIRDSVADILTQVGRFGFFDEYTDHSFGHVKSMLDVAEWIIPAETFKNLSPADCLIIVLGTYFHDIGLLISKSEYSARARNPEYQKFLLHPVIPASKYMEFQARIDQLDSDERERILYQEFVRYSHGARVKAWIEGAPLDDDNASREIRGVVGNLFAKLDPTFRQDLALVCESHTKDDIDDIKKYKLDRPYGSSADETANLQYAAVILRTADLLQITKGRAPSILYQFVNPSDPVSQKEWQKQAAVRSVRPQPGLDKDGTISKAATPNTIEVHARFQQSDGFFGLTTYLSYAEQQIQACFAAVSDSERKLVNPPKYPWRYIDTTGVEAAGFLTEQFGFSLDQQKILDLLTGHTLYNNTSVVLREITQNALDAVRLQAEDATEEKFQGSIRIVWNSRDRVLTVTDNGTGMSQATIVNHLLKVGSSRYQDPSFKEKYPNFSSISRFGIGVLSAFMVSDDVRITTCSPDDAEARQIALRSVHGKYLIKLLDKVSDRDEIGVFPHGTSIRLVIRPTADIGDILNTARMWLLFPNCDVTVQIDDGEPVKIGYASPKDALKTYLSGVGARRRYRSTVEVREVRANGVTLAFVVGKSEFFKDWGFQTATQRRMPDDDQEKPPIGICIEGVGVDFNSPGYVGPGILAVANAVGPGSPKTNVARSALEDTAEHRAMLETIYGLYAQHVAQEISRLCSEEGFSISRAAGEAPYIVSPLLVGVSATRPALLSQAIAEIPMIMVEGDGERRTVSPKQLRDTGEFWTVDSTLSRSVETFIREAPSNITARTILKTIGNQSAIYPTGETLCNFGSSQYLDNTVRGDFEVVEVKASGDLRALNLRWARKGRDRRWVSSDEVFSRAAHFDRRFAAICAEARDRRTGRPHGGERLNLPLSPCQIEGLDDVGGFVSNGERYLKPGGPLAEFLKSAWGGEEDERKIKVLNCYLMVTDLVFASALRPDNVTEDAISRSFEQGSFLALKPYFEDMSGLVAAFRGSNLRLFDPFAWNRRDPII